MMLQNIVSIFIAITLIVKVGNGRIVAHQRVS